MVVVDATVTLEDAAKLCGKSPTTIKNWINRSGDLFVVERARRGVPWRLDMPKLLAWREEEAILAAQGDTKNMDYNEARRRKTAAEAALAELDLAVRRGELVEIEVVGAQVEAVFARIRARLLSMPGNLAASVTNESDPNVVQTRIQDEVREALNELSYSAADGEAEGEAEDGGAAGAETAAEA